jgi:4-amino-4-deoxy-L-arabinose transferase-like glycosyltransferase
MDEPSVLDYVIDKLIFWKQAEISLPGEEDKPSEEHDPAVSTREKASWDGLLLLLPVTLALIGQSLLEPPYRAATAGVLLYLISISLLVWLILRGTWKLNPVPPDQEQLPTPRIRFGLLAGGVVISILAYLLFLGNMFTIINFSLWVVGFGLIWASLRISVDWWGMIRTRWENFKTEGFQVNIWHLAVLSVFALSAFYRFYRLSEVPPEMFSDHAEKLIDVTDVLRGQFRIFFPRNTGREAFQMYLTAVVARIFGTGISFESLKIGTCLAGLFTLPFIYLLGKEIADREVGLLAMFFAGVAYWPNVISRVALRFTLYPFFTAPVLYFLIRGLKRKRWNDFLLAGLALGLGLHGYSPYRIVPVLVVIVILIYLLHTRTPDQRRLALSGLFVIALISLIVFLPLLRYATTNIDKFTYRMGTRLTGIEAEIPGSPLLVFLDNLGKSLVMFQWDNGGIWVHSVPIRPALGIVSAVLFTFGVVLVVIRYLKRRSWVDLTLLLSILILILPSALSLAFPDENPSLNRTGGALIPVFIIVSIALISLFRNMKKNFSPAWSTAVSSAVLVVLIYFSASQNYTLVFDTYYNQFKRSAWNTSEIGAVIKEYTDTVGDPTRTWVIPYPHWVDTRLVGIHAQGAVIDYALGQKNIIATEDYSGPKLYIYKPEDFETEKILSDLYPSGIRRLYSSDVRGRDFVLYYVLD